MIDVEEERKTDHFSPPNRQTMFQPQNLKNISPNNKELGNRSPSKKKEDQFELQDPNTIPSQA